MTNSHETSPTTSSGHARPPWWRRLLFPLGMTAAGVGVFWMIAGHTLSHGEVEQLPPETPRQSSDPNAVAVTASPVTLRPVRRMVEAVGTLWGYEEVSLKAKVEGRVKRVLHDVSDRVGSGETIVELDATDAELAVRQAEKNLLIELARLGLTEAPTKDFDVWKVPLVTQAQIRAENAKSKVDRAVVLVKRSVISNEELADRQTEHRAAEAELANQVLVANAGLATIQLRQESLAIAQKQLEDTVIRVPFPSSPIPGMDQAVYAVTSRNLSEGTYVRVGDEVCRLVIDHTLKLRVAVPERHSAEIRVGQLADIFTSSLSTPVSGKVARINPAVQQSTRTFEVEILCPNGEGKLKAGGFAKAEIATHLDEATPTVPLESLVTFAGITKIFVIEGEAVREVRVALGVQDTDWVEIATPRLPAEAQVVTSGQTALADGTAVFVRESDSPRQTAQERPAGRKSH